MDNLKARIAEAIGKEMGDIIGAPEHHERLKRNRDLAINRYAKAVLDVVEPMIPKWMPIDDLAYDKQHGYSVSHQVLLNEHHPETNMNTFVLSRIWEEDDEKTIIDARHRRGIERVTHFMPLPTPPAKE